MAQREQNLVLNPRGRNTSAGTVVVRENLFTTSRVGVLAFGGPTDGTSSVSILGGNPNYRSYAMPVAPGEVYSITRTALTGRFRYVFTSGTPAAGVANFGGTGMSTAHDSSLVIENIVVPAAATHIVIYLDDTGATVPPMLIERGPKALPYFDGATSPDPDLTPVWVGAVGTSMSQLLGPRPTHWTQPSSNTNGVLYYSASQDALALRIAPTRTGNTYVTHAIANSVMPAITLLTDFWSARQTAGVSVYKVGGPPYVSHTPLNGGSLTYRVVGEAPTTGNVVVNIEMTTTEPGDVIYFRAAVVPGEYQGKFFDGNMALTPTTLYGWEGIANNSISTSTTIRTKTPCGMYAASDEFRAWIKAPDESVTINTEGWGATGTYLSGGAYVRTSANRHKTYAFAWTEIDEDDLLTISDFYDGLHGDGPFFFALPGTYRNILPQSWATPRLACLDAPPLVENAQPRALAAPQTDRGFPTASAVYNIIGTDDRRQVLPIYIPEDMVLHLGVRGSFSGTAHIEYKVDGEARTLAPVSGNDLTNSFVLGPAKVELSLQGEGTASINAMTAALRATFTPPAGRFVSGQGHSGVKFPENGMSKTLISATRNRWNAALTAKEVGQWL